MDQDDIIKKKQDNFNGSLNIQENETIVSENKEEIDPMPENVVQIKDVKDPLDDCHIDENQENSNTAEHSIRRLKATGTFHEDFG